MNTLATLVRIEARRPASWLLFLAAVGGASMAGSGRVVGASPVAIGFLSGGGLAVAAVAVRGPSPAGHLGGGGAGLLARIAWPLIGGVVGAAVSPAGPSVAALAGGLAGITFATMLVALLERSPSSRADVASAALLITAAVGSAAGWAWGRFQADTMAGGMAAIAAAAVTLGTAASVARMPLSPRKPRGGGRVIASGETARVRLDLVGMGAALTGMVVCLFLVPQSAPANVWLTLVCFVALAVPEATISPASLDRGWSRLLESVPLRPASGGGRFGMTDLVTETVGFHALLLGWPSLVALALSLREDTRSDAALVTVVALAVAAAVTWGVASLLRRRVDGGTTMAAVIAVLVAVCLVAMASAPPA